MLAELYVLLQCAMCDVQCAMYDIMLGILELKTVPVVLLVCSATVVPALRLLAFL